MALDTSIPGFPQIDAWPTPPAYPVTIAEFSRHRDGGPQGGTAFAVLEDANQSRYSVCFDRFLGRLCFGGTHTAEDDVAFVSAGSPLEQSILAIFEAFISHNPHNPMCQDIAEHIHLIKHWSAS